MQHFLDIPLASFVLGKLFLIFIKHLYHDYMVLITFLSHYLHGQLETALIKPQLGVLYCDTRK
jgi:hypothetical protein